jgi:hypothetical protein
MLWPSANPAWRYLKVPQKAFNQLQPADLADLVVLGN